MGRITICSVASTLKEFHQRQEVPHRLRSPSISMPTVSSTSQPLIRPLESPRRSPSLTISLRISSPTRTRLLLRTWLRMASSSLRATPMLPLRNMKPNRKKLKPSGLQLCKEFTRLPEVLQEVCHPVVCQTCLVLVPVELVLRMLVMSTTSTEFSNRIEIVYVN